MAMAFCFGDEDTCNSGGRDQRESDKHCGVDYLQGLERDKGLHLDSRPSKNHPLKVRSGLNTPVSRQDLPEIASIYSSKTKDMGFIYTLLFFF